jgi:orotate phosphoribosyltransferase
VVPARLSVVTLGARDLDRLRDFYRGLGWRAEVDLEGFAAFRTRGAVLTLYPRAQLAADTAGVEGGEAPTRSTLAVNVEARAQVDTAIAAAERAGARVSRPADAEWGGRSGHFADPEGNVWEVAWVPPGNAMAALVAGGEDGAETEAGTGPRERLVAELREHALVVGEVTLTSGRTARYYVDAKRAILRPAGFRALGELVADAASELGATAVGGMTMGADPVACAALAYGPQLKAFFVRKERKEHGLERWVEGPPLDRGERCLVVEDVVTTGGSTVRAIERVRSERLTVAGVVSVLDRLAGGGEAIEAAAEAPYTPLTTIDDVYPERPDR